MKTINKTRPLIIFLIITIIFMTVCVQPADAVVCVDATSSEVMEELTSDIENYRSGAINSETVYTDISPMIGDDEWKASIDEGYKNELEARSKFFDICKKFAEYVDDLIKAYEAANPPPTPVTPKSVTVSASSSDDISVNISTLKSELNNFNVALNAFAFGSDADSIMTYASSLNSMIETDEMETLFIALSEAHQDFNTAKKEFIDLLEALLAEVQEEIAIYGPIDAKRETSAYHLLEPQKIKNETMWDCIWFGNYTTLSSDSFEPIKWRVLAIECDYALLISDMLLDIGGVCDNSEGDPWEDCSLRNWLNNDFYNKAFNDEEKESIKETAVTTEDSPILFDGVPAALGGNATKDRVFIPSLSEVTNEEYGFFTNYYEKPEDNNSRPHGISSTRVACNTKYAVKKGAWMNELYEYMPKLVNKGNWWLRTRSYNDKNYYVAYRGNITDQYSNYDEWSIRPCIRIDLSFRTWKHAGRVWSDGSVREVAIPEKKTDISDAVVSGVSSKTYTGKARTQKFDVIHNGSLLIKGTDYAVSYKNNTKIGKASVTIKGINKYEGSLTKTFKIKPAKVTGLKLTTPKSKQLKVTWSKAKGGVSYNVWYRVKGTSKWKKTTATGTSKLLKKLKAGKTYQVKVRAFKKVNGTTYTGAWTAIKSLKVKK